MTKNIPLGLYIHFPWCIQKCPYCDFNSHEVKNNIPEPAYINTLLADLRLDLQQFKDSRPISSIFLGGGTPSLFSPKAIDELLTGIKQQTSIRKDAEITLEANPGTFESAKFQEFRSLGITRLSIGIQSFNDKQLKLLGRVHSANEAIRAAEIAHQSGFDNFNIDLMFGLPSESLEQAKTDIETAISLKPAHISYYQLTLEPNTWFYKNPPTLPNDDDIFRTQQTFLKTLESHGYQQYEISAFALQGRQCRHNLNYWQFGDYLGIGAGAHGKISRRLPDRINRYWKAKHPDTYLKSIGTEQCMGVIQGVPPAELPLEFVMNHLRLKKGFSIKDFILKTGLPAEALEPTLTQCIEENLLQIDGKSIICSKNGWNFLDIILEKFIPS